MNIGGGRLSFCSTSVGLLSFSSIAGMALDLLAAVHGGGDNEVISGVSCCGGGGVGGSSWDLLEFCEGAGLGGLGNCPLSTGVVGASRSKEIESEWVRETMGWRGTQMKMVVRTDSKTQQVVSGVRAY